MLLFLILEGDLDEFCQTVDQLLNVGAEVLFDLTEVDLIAAVLDRVVQERRADRVGVELECGDDLGNGDGVANKLLAAGAVLPRMELTRVEICFFYLFQIVVLSGLFKREQQL